MWARLKLDIGWSDLAVGLVRSAFSANRGATQERIERSWLDGRDALVCFSARSGFDLALQCLALPPRSEILFSALNVRGMIKIARRHGVLPVPLDLHPDTMLPEPAALERAMTPQTRALVVAPLFGARADLTPLIETARAHGLFVFEDCAQAFAGCGYRGHEAADLTLFSFGPLKFSTALGGAVLQVRDPALREAMRKLQDSYPVQPTAPYAIRLLKFAALKLVTTRPILGALTAGFRAIGRDYEDTLSDSVRGVAKLGSSAKLRKRCPAAMLAVLERRLRRFDTANLAARARAGQRLLALLDGAVVCPASGSPVHHFWVFPILASDPDALIGELRRNGFDAAKLARSQTVAPPPDRSELEPTVARDTLARLVVLPCYPDMPDPELRRLAGLVRRVCA
jgi:perosamine synthetase